MGTGASSLSKRLWAGQFLKEDVSERDKPYDLHSRILPFQQICVLTAPQTYFMCCYCFYSLVYACSSIGDVCYLTSMTKIFSILENPIAIVQQVLHACFQLEVLLSDYVLSKYFDLYTIYLVFVTYCFPQTNRESIFHVPNYIICYLKLYNM